MQTLSREAQQRLDAQAEAAGIPSLILMERAGSAVAEHIIQFYEDAVTIHVFCGVGKNAGDAYVVARLLAAHFFDVNVWELDTLAARKSEISRTDTGIMRKAMRGMGIEPMSFESFTEKLNADQLEFYEEEGSVLAIDGILGTGYMFSRPLSTKWAEATVLLNALRHDGFLEIISIDIPTGVDATTGLVDPYALSVDTVITFEYTKTGLASFPGISQTKDVVDASLGLSPEFLDAFWDQESSWVDLPDFFDIASLLPERFVGAHKGSFGKSLAICGSRDMAGAAILAASAAMQSGLGLLTVLVPESIYNACLQAVPSVLWTVMEKDEAALKQQVDKLLEDKTSALLGSGSANLSESCMRILLSSLQDASIPLVLDAAALNYLATDEGFANTFFENRAHVTILTPHPGEFARLAPDLSEAGIGRIEQAEQLAKRYQSIVVLKGMATVIAESQRNTSLNNSGNRGMAKAGTGDVLAGMILAFAAMPQLDAYEASLIAAFVHGYAADLVEAKDTVFAVSAETIVQNIPLALESLDNPEDYLSSLLNFDEHDFDEDEFE